MMKAALLLACGMVFCSNALAEENKDGWLYAFSSGEDASKGDFYMKSSTFRHKDDTSSMLIKEVAVNSAHETYYKVEVSDETCDNGYGKVIFKDMDGRKVTDLDYATGAKANGAFFADMMCVFRRNVR